MTTTTPSAPASAAAVSLPSPSPSPSLTLAGANGAEILSLEGEERIGRLPRLALSFALAGELDPGETVGAPAWLDAGGRVFGGVIAELEASDVRADGRTLYRATLAPRAWLLSRGRRSRFFERLSTPDIVELVVATSGVALRVERRLRETYLPRACTVQHRESDLDFVSRLLEKEGVCLVVEDDGERCTLTLADHNDALPHAGDVASASGVRRTGALLPRRVELVSLDPAHPELPLRAAAIVSATGVGEIEIHDVPFTTPEDGARAARIYAEWLRCTATVTHGAATGPLAAARRARVSGREVVLTAVRHAFSREAGWTSRFEAAAAEAPVRPERVTRAPRVVGLQGGRLCAREVDHARVRGEDGLFRVRDVAGAVDRVMPMAAGQAIERELAAGTQVVWGCIDGDPELPVITAVLSDTRKIGAPAGRAVLRGPGGSMLELGGALAPDLGRVEGVLEERGGRADAPEVAHHAAAADGESEEGSTGTGSTDTWMRLAVPHTAAKTWSYFRIGEAATDTTTTISATDGSTFKESSTQCGSLVLNGYDATKLAGAFDYTDKHRTSITKGNWEQVVQGDGRLAIYSASTTGPAYELSVTEDSKDDKTVHVTWGGTKFDYTSGATMTLFGGAAATQTVGWKIDSMLGGSLNLAIGMSNSVTVGYTTSFVFADSYEFRRGEQLSSASTIDQRASKQIQFSVHDGAGGFSKEMGVALAVTAIAAAFQVGAFIGPDAEAKHALGDPAGEWFHNNSKLAMGLVNGGIGLAEPITFVVMRARSTERSLEDGNPILTLDKVKSQAALRSDDWLMMMTPDWAVLGKNKKYPVDLLAPLPTEEISVSKLDLDGAGTAIILEENNKITIQAGAEADKKATITFNDKGITITADTFDLKGTTADSTITMKGKLTLDGDLVVKKTLTVEGTSNLKAKITGPSGNEIK